MKLIIFKVDNEFENCSLINENLITAINKTESGSVVIETTGTFLYLGRTSLDEQLNFMLELQSFLKNTFYGVSGFLINKDKNNFIQEYKLIPNVKNEPNDNTQ